MSEPVLVDEVSAAPPSFEEYVAARGDALWRSAWLLTGDAHRAEDLVQAALVTCWRRWDRIARDGSVDGYVREGGFTELANAWDDAERMERLERKEERGCPFPGPFARGTVRATTDRGDTIDLSMNRCGDALTFPLFPEGGVRIEVDPLSLELRR